MEKYNDILLLSMCLAVAEDFTGLIILNKDDTDFELIELLQNKGDFTNLIILNKDDKEFELIDLLKDKDQFSNYVMKEFLKQNSSTVANELSTMDEKKMTLQKQTKI